MNPHKNDCGAHKVPRGLRQSGECVGPPEGGVPGRRERDLLERHGAARYSLYSAIL